MPKKTLARSALSPALHSLFLVQLQGKGPVVPEVQRAALRMAERAGAHEVLRKLAERADAPADVLESIRKVSDIPVRVAYLLRSEHTPQVLRAELAGEKRAGVLSALVESEGISAEVLSTIGQVFLQRPTKALAEALLVRWPDDEVLCGAYTAMAGRYIGLTRTLQGACRTAALKLADSEWRSQAALASAGSELSRYFFGAQDLTAEARTALVERGMLGVLDTVGQPRNGRRSYPADRAVRSVLEGAEKMLACEDLQPEVVERLKAVAEHSALLLGESKGLSDKVAEWDPKAVRPSTHSAREASGRTLDELVKLALEERDDVLVVSLLRNPEMSVETAEQLLGRVQDRTYLVKSLGGMRDEVADLVYLLDAALASREAKFANYSDPEAAKVRLVRKAVESETQNSKPYSYYAFTGTIAALAEHGLPDEAVKELPWKYFTSREHYYRTAGMIRPAQQLARLQASVLGESEEHWETFNALGSSFEGKVGDLLGMVETLCSGEV